MANKYCCKSGNIIDINELEIKTAKEFAVLIEQEIIPFIKIIEIKKSNENELIIFDIEIEVSQLRKNDIKSTERIAVSFVKDENRLPIVEALRMDFPRVPHLNLTQDEFPKNICLFDKSYEELESALNPAKILSQIRYWLEATADGRLHDSGQQLEPTLLNSNYTIFLSNKIIESRQLPLFKIKQFKNKMILLPLEEVEYNANINNLLCYHPILVIAKPQVHGNILKTPRDIEALKFIASSFEIDIIKEMQIEIEKIIKLPTSNNKNLLLNAKLLIILSIPKKRNECGETETYEYNSFATTMTIKELGKKLGIINEFNNFNGLIIGRKDNAKDLDNISIIHLNTGLTMSKKYASAYNNEHFDENPNILIIGVGALGSKLCMNLVRAGFGNLNLVDKDWFLPHNAARHVLTKSNIGESKAEAMCNIANSIVDEDDICKYYSYDVLNDKKEVEPLIKKSDIVLDFSTSIAVERYLGIDVKATARNFSVFLNPSGNDLVILAEDIEKKCRIDWIEMQYYRYVINELELEKHISDFPEDIRYSNSCRDISSRIPNDYITMHAATASRIIKSIYKDSDAKILISHLSNLDFNLTTKKYNVNKLMNFNVEDWSVCTDQYFINLMQNKRKEKLPNETGGIILGSFDFKRKIIYMVDIYCPKDNQEYLTSFIRGCKKLQEKLEEISINTAGNIEYVGEWHSHPVNSSTYMSSFDKELLEYLHVNRLPEGHPGVVVIIGDENKKIGIYIK